MIYIGPAAGLHNMMKRNPNFVLRDIGGQALLVPLGPQVNDITGLVLLNETGRFVWDLIAKEHSIDDLAVAVAQQFDVDFSLARADVQAILSDFATPSFDGSLTAPSPDYGPVVRELHQLAAMHNQPVNGIFELTSRCNLNCRMCYVRHPAGAKAQRDRELTASEWLSLATDAVAHGLVFLILTGGEILLRPDFFDIYEPLTRIGLIITLYTNGTLITDAIAQRLAQVPPSSTEITLYGATAATYEAVTGVPGSYARCCAGIEAILAYGIPVEIKTTLTRQNVSELEAMRQMAHNWGLPFSAGWLLSKRRDGAASDVETCRLSASECVALEATDRASAVERSEAALRDNPSDRADNFYCYAGKASFVVTSSGEMNACLDLPMPAERPLVSGFSSAWYQLQCFVASAPFTASVCLACVDRAQCPRCPAWSSLETNTLTEPVPYLCDIARARQEHYARNLKSS